ncbi:MAG: acyl-CoA dehydrogenase family protein [Dehalococcoidia bacterium]
MTTEAASDEQTARTERLLALAAALADDFAIRAAEHDRENTFPFENFEAMRREKYLTLTLPDSLGGLGATIKDFALCQERLAQGDGATALAVNMHLFALGAMAERGSFEQQQAQMLIRMAAEQGWVIGGGYTEPEIGGNWGFPATTAEHRPGIYVLNGRKTFTSMAPIINFFIINATLQSDDGPMIGTFLVPKGTPGIEVLETWDTMGMRATASHDLLLKDVAVPEQSLVLSRPPGDLDPEATRLFAWFGLSIASVYTGIAIAARDFAVEFAKTRRPSVMPRPIAHLPGIQFLVAEMDIKLAAARALTLRVADEWRAGRHHDPSGLSAVVMPKYVATNSAIEVVNHAMQLVGGVGMFKRHPLERHYRDVRAGTFHPFANDIAKEVIGKAGLGIPMNDDPRWG